MPGPSTAPSPETRTLTTNMPAGDRLGPNSNAEYAGHPNLEGLSESEDAVFAIDSEQRVVSWSRGCETLLGRPSSGVLGRRCFDVIAGHDLFGNRYCVPSCPLVFEARIRPAEVIRPIVLDVPLNGGLTSELVVNTRVVPGEDPARPLIVHRVHRDGTTDSAVERDVSHDHPARARMRSKALADPTRMSALTSRERDVLACLGAGLTTGATAERLFVSATTVRNHVAKLLQKLEVHTRGAAVALYYEHRVAGSRLPDGRDTVAPRSERLSR